MKFRVALDVEIREIVEDDLVALRDWYGAERDESFRLSFQRHLIGEVVYLVAVGNGKAVGHLGVDLVRKRGVAYLWQFGVERAVQSLGIGSRMVGVAEATARQRDLNIAEIAVEFDNPRARSLYERLGYGFVGEEDGEWLLRKDLAATGSRIVEP